MTFPAAIPEIPVTSIDAASDHYIKALGFRLDWGDEAGGIAGLSRGSCRLFLANSSFRGSQTSATPVVIWLNLATRSEVDELFREWKAAGAHIAQEPEDKAWKLHEFTAADPDGNHLRVFYDFHAEP